jgi:hypothetical protein
MVKNAAGDFQAAFHAAGKGDDQFMTAGGKPHHVQKFSDASA